MTESSSSANGNAAIGDGTMKAFVIANPGDSGSIVTRPIPTAPPGFALVKVLRAGICNTDLEIRRGYMGFSGVLGHEFVGRVVSVNTTDDAEKSKWTAQRVCGDINLGCGDCGVCSDALLYETTTGGGGCCSKMSRNHCPNRTVLGILNKDGTFAEYITLPLRNLHLVPDGLSDEAAVFSEPLAAACRVLEQGLVNFKYDDCNGDSHPRGGDRVAILGDGKLGLLVAEVMGREYIQTCGSDCQSPPPPVLFGKHPHKLDLVSDSGVRTALVSEVKDESSFSGVSPAHAAKYDLVVDATGNPDGLKLAAGMCRPMGTLVLKSTCASGVEGFNSAPFVIDELRVVGSRCGPVDRALELLSGGEGGDVPPLRMEKYVTKQFKLSEGAEAIECAALKSTMKVLLVMDEE